ncbi:putative holin-like toxin [Jeotgalibacillus marinus]|uniref:Holin-like toxin n=1 Tax=Jeotgalibacillus marinus TaxID=86667 RepID=A0ABV3Q896_9BACL
MTIFESFMLMISFSALVVTILSFNHKK